MESISQKRRKINQITQVRAQIAHRTHNLSLNAEIVVGNRVITLKSAAGKLAVDKVFTGQYRTGTMHHDDDEQHHGPTVCLADLTSSPGLEIVAGTSLYRLPTVADCAAQPMSDYCQNRLTSVWNAETVKYTATF